MVGLCSVGKEGCRNRFIYFREELGDLLSSLKVEFLGVDGEMCSIVNRNMAVSAILSINYPHIELDCGASRKSIIQPMAV